MTVGCCSNEHKWSLLLKVLYFVFFVFHLVVILYFVFFVFRLVVILYFVFLYFAWWSTSNLVAHQRWFTI